MIKLNFTNGMNLVIFGLVISTLVGYWMGSVRLINAVLTIATILMAGFVAHQAWATYGMIKQSHSQLIQLIKQVKLEEQALNEMRKQRLTPIVVNAIAALHSLEYKIKTNFELIRQGTFNSDYPENLLEIRDELEKPELLLVDRLLELELYRDLKFYQENLEKLQMCSEKIKKLAGTIGEGKLMEILKEVQKETGIEIKRTKGNAIVMEDRKVLLPEGEESVYAIILGLARETASGSKDADSIYWRFRGKLQESDDEDMKKLGERYLQELHSAIWVLLPVPDEKDAEQKAPQDKRVKKIEIAIERLMKEYIK